MNTRSPLLALLVGIIALSTAGCSTMLPSRDGARPDEPSVPEGRAFRVTFTGDSREDATQRALQYGAIQAERLQVSTEARTRNGDLQSVRTQTRSPVYLYDYEELDYTRRGSMHTVSVSATYLLGEDRDTWELLLEAEKAYGTARRITPPEPWEIDWHHSAEHVRFGHALILVPMEFRFYPRPEGVRRAGDIGFMLEALYDHAPPGDGPDGKSSEEWFVDTQYLGLIPWAASPNAGLLFSAEIGITDYAFVGRSDYDDPEPEEIGVPRSRGWQPFAGFRSEMVLHNGWGVNHTIRYLSRASGDDDIFNSVQVFKEWYKPENVSHRAVVGYRLGLGYTRLDGGVLDGYDGATLQFGVIY